MKKVTIHQPDFMPWLGFFNKINKADIFVVLDHTENNPRDSGFWGRRVKVISNKKDYWLSIPLVKPAKGIIGQPISEMKINLNEKKNFKKSITLIKQNYAKTPYFSVVFPIIDNYFNSEEEFLCIRNMEFIKTIIKELNISTEIIYSSSLNCEKKSTELLIEIVNKTNGNIYLCGDGADGYQIDELFKNEEIGLEYNNFKHPIYNQINTDSFIPGLSIIDSLMNIGFNGVAKLLEE
jgi:hypothetical protein